MNKTSWQFHFCAFLFTIYTAGLDGVAWADNPACQVQEPSKVTTSDNALIFELVTICQVASIDTAHLVDRYIAHTQTRDAFHVIETKKVSTEGQGKSSVISVVENLQTAHGDMRIEADIVISGDGSDETFSYLQLSNHIEATGASAFTRKVIESVDVGLVDEGFQVRITKVLHMKKPWYAPFGIFRKEVYKGLGKDLQLIADRHLGVLQADSLENSQ